MISVPEAVNALKESLREKGVGIHTRDAFDHLASCLVLLDSSSPSIQMIRKLCTVMRQPLLPLYNACLQPALRLSSSVLSTVLGRLCNAHNVEGETSRAAWDEAAQIVLSGILDFLEQKECSDVKSEVAVWDVLYCIICEFFFHDPGQREPVFSVTLRVSAYNTLIEIASREITARNALRQKVVLGGERLGAAISRTRDYLALEALLMLFGRLLPPIHNTSRGKSKRVKFVEEVLGSPKLFRCHAELLDTVQKTSGTHWDDVTTQITDVLAKSDIAYPQPFSIDEIDVCGRVFPQPLAADRLIVDKQAFLVNIVFENDYMCETLQVMYSHIHAITLDNSGQNVSKGKVLITISLTSPPLVANTEMKSHDGSQPHAKFWLQSDAVGRFMEALRRRGVGKLSFLNSLTREQRKRKSISIGSGVEFTGDSYPIPPTASFEGKVQHVNQVYKTDNEDLSATEAIPVLSARSLVPDILEVVVPADVPATVHATGSRSPTNEGLEHLQHSIFSLQGNSTLLGDCDELSEISEFEPTNCTINERAVTGPVTLCSQKLKPSHYNNRTRTRISESPNAFPAMATEKHSEFSKTGMLTSNSPPISGSFSSIQINVSPKLLSSTDALSNPVGSGDLSVPSKDFIITNGLEKTGADELWPCDTEPISASAGQPQTESSSTDGEPGQHVKRATPSSPNLQGHSHTRITGNAGVPLKIIGSRRKRETKSSSKAVIKVEDESNPPRKKRRNARAEIKEGEDKIDTLSIARPIRHTTVATRRSSRVKKRMPAPGGTRNNGNYQSTCAVECSKVASLSLQEAPGLDMGSDFPRTDSGLSLVDMSGPHGVTPEVTLLRDTQEATSVLPWQPSVTPIKEPQQDLDFVQRAASSVIQLVQEHGSIKTERTVIDQHIVADPRAVDKDVQEDAERQVCMKENNDSQRSSRPTAESPRTKIVTIDLTSDDSPNRERSKQQRTPVDLVCLAADTQATKSTAPDQISVETSAFFPSPRHRRRSVTFASPIEYVLDKKLDPNFQASPSSCLSPLPPESIAISPLRIPTSSLNARCGTGSPNRIIPRVALPKPRLQTNPNALTRDQIVDEVEIQDIVKVLDEIQAVIIKGISDKFRNAKKDVQRSRDDLIQQALDELQGMVTENAKYFNGLLRLEEDYYRNGKAITRFWEELIDSSDGIATQVRKILKEQDQSVSARTFPKTLLPLRPNFFCSPANV